MEETPRSKLYFEGPRGPLFKALAEARKHFTPLTAEAQADVRGTSKSGKEFSYKFNYAPLDVVLAAVNPGLHKANLAISQPFDGRTLYTILAFEDSSMIVETTIPQWSTAQDLGGLLTYLRRYQLKGILGVADQEDDDANEASGNKAQVTRKEPSASKPSGPKISDDLKAEITGLAKEKEMPGPEFHKLAQETCGKPWGEFTELDGKKFLAALVMK